METNAQGAGHVPCEQRLSWRGIWSVAGGQYRVAPVSFATCSIGRSRHMLNRILLDLGGTSLLCLGERVLERILLPGLHRTAARMAAADPARADDILTLIAEAIGLFAVIWLFNGSLYAIGYLSRRPLKPQVPMLIALIILTLTFAASYAQWATLPPG
jgi:hypothetical protein